MQLFIEKMRGAGCSEVSIRAFVRAWNHVASGAVTSLAEDDIQPVTSLPQAADLRASGHAPIDQVVVIKLNGGLGTSMGLTGPKSLLPVRGNLTFLDLMARQIIHQRQRHPHLRFLLMNSFSTIEHTRAALPAELGDPAALGFLQNRVPKLLAGSLEPLTWPADPELEWCPPGHGDLYVALLQSGQLQQLLDAGVRYAFVSNSDNLGATLDPTLLSHFAESDSSFMMEVTRRTPSDRKGGHLALTDRGLVLREAAMCATEDMHCFQDIERHRFFNTNNLWLRLDRLASLLEEHDGVLPLPVICNSKTADPRDPSTPPVFQLESAMGSAISCFPDARAIEVGRSRFAPVKKTSDLLVVRSDAYRLTADHRVVLATEVQPTVLLPADLRRVDQLDRAIPSPPSLRNCRRLEIRGPVQIQPGTTFEGSVTIVSGAENRLPRGTYRDTTVQL